MPGVLLALALCEGEGEGERPPEKDADGDVSGDRALMPRALMLLLLRWCECEWLLLKD
jgi:hypothetical protein